MTGAPSACANSAFSPNEAVADDIGDAVHSVLGQALPSGGTATVCFSGGIDSRLLLELSAKSAPGNVTVKAVHVNHGLSPSAGKWEDFCQKECASLQVPLTVKKASLDPKAQGLEERARKARLECYASVESGAFLMAHHAGDLAETVLLRLFRGSGPRGMASMRPVSNLPGTARPLLRPLLGFGKERIIDAAEKLGLAGIDDPANRELAHNRNWLRHEVLPEAAKRFPGAMEALAKAARNADETAALLDILAGMDDGSCRQDGRMDHESLAALGEARVRNWLSWSLASRGQQSASAGQLEECARQLCGGKPGFMAEFGALRLVGSSGVLEWQEGENNGAIGKMSNGFRPLDTL